MRLSRSFYLERMQFSKWVYPLPPLGRRAVLKDINTACPRRSARGGELISPPIQTSDSPGTVHTAVCTGAYRPALRPGTTTGMAPAGYLSQPETWYDCKMRWTVLAFDLLVVTIVRLRFQHSFYESKRWIKQSAESLVFFDS